MVTPWFPGFVRYVVGKTVAGDHRQEVILQQLQFRNHKRFLTLRKAYALGVRLELYLHLGVALIVAISPKLIDTMESSKRQQALYPRLVVPFNQKCSTMLSSSNSQAFTMPGGNMCVPDVGLKLTQGLEVARIVDI